MYCCSWKTHLHLKPNRDSFEFKKRQPNAIFCMKHTLLICDKKIHFTMLFGLSICAQYLFFLTFW